MKILGTVNISRSRNSSGKSLMEGQLEETQLCEYKHIQVRSVPVGSSMDVFKVKTAFKDQH